ncbi:MAG TPA: Fic family protein [Chitinophaga sp.]|uniref:Fic family protein n=1 Tax=Chitinophaga sp. TaxID=1869181 RepID=UPI002F95EC79
MYIHQLKEWPDFQWDSEQISTLLAEVRYRQGRLLGHMESLGFRLKEEATLQTLTMDVLKSSEIEGEILNPDQVRSSIARRLGMDVAGLVPSDRNVEGVVEMMLDATQQYTMPLTDERLFGWHASLFPTGRSGMHKIVVGAWRDNAKNDPMQVVSGAMGRTKVHFQAPDADILDKEMSQFLDWFNTEEKLDPVLKAAIAHLWFVTIHPFDDGNGRITRAITDMQLSRADGSRQRFYSMSAQIRIERNNYYNILERTQKDTLDITAWLDWFLTCLNRAITATDDTLAAVIRKARFWEHPAAQSINERQRLMLNKLLDGFHGKLTSSKWATIAKCSQDTAIRDIQDLIERGLLVKEAAGGRSTSYVLSE